MDRGVWWAAVHGVVKGSDNTEKLTLSLPFPFPIFEANMGVDTKEALLCFSCSLTQPAPIFLNWRMKIHK